MSKKIQYRNQVIWISIRKIASVFIFLGIISLACIYDSPKPEYADMLEADITIQSIKEHPAGRNTNGGFTITSDENELFSITGAYNACQIQKNLTRNALIHIKYYESSLFKLKNIVELSVGNTKLVTYVKSTTSYRIVLVIIGLILIVIGISFWVFGKRFKQENIK